MTKKTLVLLLLTVVLLLGMTIVYLCSKLPSSARRMKMPIAALDEFYSDKVLGATLDKESTETVFRVFVPRAAMVELCLFDAPRLGSGEGARRCSTPIETVEMKCDRNGVWEVRQAGLLAGQYYMFRVRWNGVEFDPQAYVGDPYARAVAHAENCCIVIDPEATNDCFRGWTDADYSSPQWSDLVIYETHIRDFCAHPSAGTGRELSGKYRGFSATAGKGAGIDHLKKLGVNMVELMPVAEFANSSDRRSSGYGSTHLFAPEASYGCEPLSGSQYYEFKQLVDDLHGHGFGVIMDVGYGHISDSASFAHLGPKYYYHSNSGHTNRNSSARNSNVRTEAPMMRRLILDNVRYWMDEFHIDGFRFDRTKLVDTGTLMAVRDMAREIDPNVLLISEHYGSNDQKRSVDMAGWQVWNDEFCDSVRHFVTGEGNRDEIIALLEGSLRGSLPEAGQMVNYLDSHNGLCLADELALALKNENRLWEDNDLRCNCLAATILFISRGIPMLSGGQEFMCSKGGIRDSGDGGDRVNALPWNNRRQRSAGEVMKYYRGLIQMRLSRAGKSLRLNESEPSGYYKWIMPDNNQAFGCIINGDQKYPGAGFVVLLNASEQALYFDVSFPAGHWRMVGDGRRIDPEGMSGSYTVSQPIAKKVLLPAFASRIFLLMDKP